MSVGGPNLFPQILMFEFLTSKIETSPLYPLVHDIGLGVPYKYI